jgi:hypothetical protein
LHAVTDLALNHRWPEGTYSCGEDFVYLCHESNVRYEH